MLSVILLSLSTAFASDDASSDIIASDDEINVEEPLAEVDDSQSVGANTSTVTTNIVNSANINDFIDESGNIKDEITYDELIFEGNFENLKLSVNRSITLTSNNAFLNNPDIKIYSGNVIFKGFAINQTNGSNSILVDNTNIISNVTLSDLTINFADDASGADAIAIKVANTNYFKLLNSAINYVGSTNSYYINNALRISNSNNSEIKNNKINAKLPSAAVGWAEIPPGSKNWVSSPTTEGIVIMDSDNVIFANNKVDVTYNAIAGSYDTIYSVDFKNTNNSFIMDNEIISTGYTYIYGIIITDDNFFMSSNIISSTGDFYANGVDIEGPAYGTLINNTIDVTAKTSVYGIYSL